MSKHVSTCSPFKGLYEYQFLKAMIDLCALKRQYSKKRNGNKVFFPYFTKIEQSLWEITDGDGKGEDIFTGEYFAVLDVGMSRVVTTGALTVSYFDPIVEPHLKRLYKMKDITKIFIPVWFGTYTDCGIEKFLRGSEQKIIEMQKTLQIRPKGENRKYPVGLIKLCKKHWHWKYYDSRYRNSEKESVREEAIRPIHEDLLLKFAKLVGRERDPPAWKPVLLQSTKYLYADDNASALVVLAALQSHFLGGSYIGGFSRNPFMNPREAQRFYRPFEEFLLNLRHDDHDMKQHRRKRRPLR